MATMLLMGTNVWAASHVMEDGDNLQQLVAAANDGDEFVFNTLWETQDALWLGTGKHIIFTLNTI